jgi:hypothetical protein
MADIEPKIEEAITEALPADMKPLFKTLLDAKNTSREMQSTAAEKYNTELEKIVGPERAKPKSYRGWRGQGTQRKQKKGDKAGGAAPKKVLKEI